MSWLSSYFSPSPKSLSTPSKQPPHEKRLLEEPQKPSIPPSSQLTTVQQPPTSSETQQVDRPNRNKVIFGAGLAFFAFSLLITRRSFARKRLAVNPAFYTNAPGHHAEQAKKVSPAMEALEALNIATVNVLSVTMMATGGALWYLDINSLAEARKLIRGGLGVDGTGRSEQDAEEEFEEWMATTLARKDTKTAKHPEAEARR